MKILSDTKVVVHGLTFEKYISETEIQQKVREIGQALTLNYQDKAPLFIAVLNGAFIFAADLVRACDLDSEICFVKLASYDGTESTGAVNTILGLDKDIKGRHLVIAEDIIDTGTTMNHFIARLQQFEPASISIVTLLLKPDALKYDIDIAHIGFEIPTKFVIGYGLDYNELGRNLKDLYQLSEE